MSQETVEVLPKGREVLGDVHRQGVESRLPVARRGQRQHHPRRGRSVEDHRSQVTAVPTRILQGQARAVRGPPQIDGAIAQRPPDLLEIVRRRRRAVVGHVGVPPSCATRQGGRGHGILKGPGQVVLVMEGAVQGMTGPGPASVHEHHVPSSPQR